MSSFTPQVKKVTKSIEKNSSAKRAYQLMQENRFDEARSTFEAILAEDPSSKPAHLGIGRICLKQKDYDGALAHFQTVRRIDPMMAQASLAIGNVYFEQNQLESAIEAFQDAISLDPSTPASYLGLGRALLIKKQYAQALEQVQKALLFDPQSIQSRLLIAHIYQEQGNSDEAIAQIESVLQINPIAWKAYQGLGNIYLKRKKYSLARKNFEEAQQINPKIPPVAKMGYLEALIEDNALNEAVAILRTIPNKKPLEARKQKFWGDIYSRQGLLKEAVESYRAANLLSAAEGELTDELSSLESLPVNNGTNIEEVLAFYRDRAIQQIAQRASQTSSNS